MKRRVLALAFSVSLLAGFQVYNPFKSFASTCTGACSVPPAGGNCQDADQSCNPSAALNCCNGYFCGTDKDHTTTGKGYCYQAH